MAIVVIAEKPSVANDIAGVLGITKKTDTHWDSDQIKITWAVGHLLQLKYMDDYDPDLAAALAASRMPECAARGDRESSGVAGMDENAADQRRGRKPQKGCHQYYRSGMSEKI